MTEKKGWRDDTEWGRIEKYRDGMKQKGKRDGRKREKRKKWKEDIKQREGESENVWIDVQDVHISS